MTIEFKTIADVFRGFKLNLVEPLIMDKLASGEEAYALMVECQKAMEEIGKRFEAGDYYISELILAARMFEKASAIISPRISAAAAGLNEMGKIVLGTPRGDIHDLGKNIFRVVAQAAGFRVIDLGIDVPPQKYLEAVQTERPRIVGMSALLTTTFPSMREVVRLLEEHGLREGLKIIIGGGATGEEARRLVGADAYTLDAGQGVSICRKFVSPEQGGER